MKRPRFTGWPFVLFQFCSLISWISWNRSHFLRQRSKRPTFFRFSWSECPRFPVDLVSFHSLTSPASSFSNTLAIRISACHSHSLLTTMLSLIFLQPILTWASVEQWVNILSRWGIGNALLTWSILERFLLLRSHLSFRYGTFGLDHWWCFHASSLHWIQSWNQLGWICQT